MKMYAHQYQWNTIHVYAIQVIPLDDQICYVQWEFMNKYQQYSTSASDLIYGGLWPKILTLQSSPGEKNGYFNISLLTFIVTYW